MSRIELRAVSKVFNNGVVAVNDVDLSVDDGEVLVLLGPTGSGKSTILRLVAGLETPTKGEVFFDGVGVDDVSAGDRHVAMVFQDYALYPHLNVSDNIAFPLKHLDEAAREARLGEVVQMLGLADVLRKRPGQLSGGQRQRVAMGRAIARPPKAFLLDQPLSSLDASARDEVRTNVLELAHALGVATIYVTHDHAEALLMADRVAVLRGGRIEQVGSPEEVYSDPRRVFVAAFVGSPRMNLLQAAIYAEVGVRTVIDLGSQTLELPWSDPRSQVLADHHTDRITVGIRPDALRPTTDAPRPGTAGGNALTGIVRMVELRGHDALVHLETGIAPTPHLISHLELPDSPGHLAHLAGSPSPKAHPVRDRLQRLIPRHRPDEPERYAVQPVYDAEHDFARQALGDLSIRMPAALAPRLGVTVSVTVDIDQLYLFDGAGERIRLPPAPGEPTPGTGAIADMTAA